MSSYMQDLSGVLGPSRTEIEVKHSTNKKAGSDLEMQDFLQLMVATFQNQTMDNTASTSEMMNQMMQMSVIQAITNISTLVSETNGLTYAASLVGKEVTVGQTLGGKLEKIIGTVTGTGNLSGEQVIFMGNEMYPLSDVLAVGRIPEEPIT